MPIGRDRQHEPVGVRARRSVAVTRHELRRDDALIAARNPAWSRRVRVVSSSRYYRSVVTDTRATWVLVLEAANELTREGRSPFKLAELVEQVQVRDPRRQRSTIQPVVQGMTENAGNGPASPCGKPLERTSHGYYRLLSTGSPVASTATRTARPRKRRGRSVSVAELRRRVDLVIAEFDRFVGVYDASLPFTRSGQYELHRLTIDRRRSLGSAVAAVLDDEFTAGLHQTLRAWSIGTRASRLVPLPEFRARLRDRADDFRDLEGLALEQLDDDDVRRLAVSLDRLIAGLGVVENKARIVAGTKSLHHVLPDLVPPMDRAWTGAFFGWTVVDPQDNQTQIFTEAFSACAEIARRTRSSRLIGAGWRTSATKLVDNALIGYCKTNGIGGAA
jgi:hypothetical protein